MEKIYKYKGEPILSQFLGFSTLILISILGIGSLLLMTLKALIIGLVLLLIVYLILSRIIKSVEFFDEFLLVNRFIGRSKKIDYNSVIRIYKNKEGFIPAYVFVLVYKNEGKDKKITISCSDSDMEVVRDKFLPNKRIHDSNLQ